MGILLGGIGLIAVIGMLARTLYWRLRAICTTTPSSPLHIWGLALVYDDVHDNYKMGAPVSPVRLPDLPYPLNPDYGSGASRRRIILRRSQGRVDASLEDIFHAMHCTLFHDGTRITDIDAALTRIPTSACPGAAIAIRELIGEPLDLASATLYGAGRPRRNCTHLFDLAVLAMAQATRDEPVRRYDMLVPDETGEPVEIEVRRNGLLVHAWRVHEDVIVTPEPLAGKPMLAGFAGWALRTFTGDALEAAMALHRTCFISRGRRFLTETRAGESIRVNAAMAGVCHSYSAERMDQAIFLPGNRRDYSGGIPEPGLD
jgi:hypothetical protein